jgi:hypothetical protein
MPATLYHTATLTTASELNSAPHSKNAAPQYSENLETQRPLKRIILFNS